MPKTGATRYQKFLKSEKAKTKLKAKKDLPRGTNVTKTNFKVKKILLREQLRVHAEDEVVTRKKLNLKELLSRLNHFNANSRTEGLNGIWELVSTHEDVLELNIGSILHGVTPMVLNIEKNVRRETLKVLHLLLTKVSAEKMVPFFDVLCTYLRCAMTHIDARIQEDSLLFLDVLLLCTPDRVAADFYKIVPNFIDMISKLRGDSKPGRTLILNLGSNLTSSKWRVKVLNRLQELLDRFVKLNAENKKSKVVLAAQSFNEKAEQFYPLNPEIKICSLPCFAPKSSQVQNVILDETEQFKKHLDTLLPLLFETWLEVCPSASKKSDKAETMVQEEAACLLKHLLEVINLLWHYVQILKNSRSSDISKWFCSNFKKAYSRHIMSVFPYHTIIRSSRDPNREKSEVFVESIVDPKMVKENLKICYLYICLNVTINMKDQTEVQSVINYIENAFSRNKEDTNNEAITQVLNLLFDARSSAWSKNPVLDNLFEKIVTTYFNTESSGFCQDLFALLCKISLDNHLSRFHKTSAHEMWLINLPNILCSENINRASVDILHKFAIQNNKVFNSTLKPKLTNILQNLPRLKITGSHENESSNKLLCLLYWINGWDNKSLNLLEGQLKENAYGNEKCKFIVEMLKIKSQGVFQ